MLDEYLQKYVETFHENFPIYGFMGIDDEEIINTIKDCIKSGKPYVLDADDDICF
jgi:hypothetical protein